MVRVKSRPRRIKAVSWTKKKKFFGPKNVKFPNRFYPHPKDKNMGADSFGHVFTRYTKGVRFGKVGEWRKLERRQPKSYTRKSGQKTTAKSLARLIILPGAFIEKTRWKTRTVSKARFVLECFEDRLLKKREVCCHGELGCLNDSITNLKISSKLSNCIDEWEMKKQPLPSIKMLQRTIDRMKRMIIDGNREHSMEKHVQMFSLPAAAEFSEYIVDFRDEKNMRVHAPTGRIETRYIKGLRKGQVCKWRECDKYYQNGIMCTLPCAFTNKYYSTNQVNPARYVLSVYLKRKLQQYEQAAHIIGRSEGGTNAINNLYDATYVENKGIDEILAKRCPFPSDAHLQECVQRLEKLKKAINT